MKDKFLTFVLIGLVVFFSGSIFADTDCDTFLLSSSLTKQSELSDASKAYLRLVQYFLNHPTIAEVEKADFLDRVLNSPTTLILFSDSNEPTSILLSSAYKKLISQVESVEILSFEWSIIKQKVAQMRQNRDAEGKDRIQKESDTAFVMEGKIQAEVEIPGGVNPNAAWLNDSNGHVYVAVTSVAGWIAVYEYSNGDLIERTKRDEGQVIFSSPSWHVDKNGNKFLAFTTRDKLVVYDFRDGRLSEGSQSINLGAREQVTSAAAWHKTADGRSYLTVGAAEQGLRFFELINGRLAKKLEPDSNLFRGQLKSTPEWVESSNGQVYLIFASTGNEIYLYELVDGDLNFKDRHVDIKPYSSLLWYEERPGEIYFVVQSPTDSLVLLEVFNGKLIKRDGFDQPINSFRQPSLQRSSNGSIYLAVSSSDNHLHLYEFISGHFLERAKEESIFEGFGGNSWVTHPAFFEDKEGRVFLAISNFNATQVFRVDSKRLTRLSAFAIGVDGDERRTSYVDSGGTVIITNGIIGKFQLISIFRKLKRQKETR